MSTREIPAVVRDAVQVVPVRRKLRPGVVGRQCIQLALVRAGGKRRRHEVCQVESLERVIDKGIDLVGESAVDLESLEVDDENRREASEGQLL